MSNNFRPFSISSVVSPYAALEAMAGNTVDIDDPHASTSTSFVPSSTTTINGNGNYSTHSQPLYDDHADGDSFQSVLLVRARFDFDAPDLNALSFRQGDVIQVAQRLESGWWDGMLGEKRGWFPSNFVEEVDEDELCYEEEQERERERERDERSRGTYSRQVDSTYDEMERGRRHESGYDEQEEGVLRMDDVLGRMGEWGGDPELEQLAREMMAGDEEDDEGRVFEQEAIARRRRQESLAKTQAQMYETSDHNGHDDDGMVDFGVVPRRREETDATIRAPTQIGQGRGIESTVPTVAGREEAQGKDKARMSLHGQPQDAWIPSLTPDGQVYYHNTHTGEDSWDLPRDAIAVEEDEQYGAAGDIYNTFSSTSATSGGAHASPLSADDDFRAPPQIKGDIPYPWVAKLSDDGRQWFYHNRLTGQSRRDPPTIRGDATSMLEVGTGVKRMSVGSGPRPLRASVELQRKAVEEWEKRTADALKAVIQPEPQPTMGLLMDNVNDALRAIFEAAVAGSAAEEEMSRAEDLGSESGMAAAIMREESAVEMLVSAHDDTLALIRQILGAFGYVGPLDKMEELPRPSWVGDMTLIGSIGLLSANTHAAVVSRKPPDSGLSVWAEVMRSASKLKDVIANFPTAVSNGVSQTQQDGAEGRRLAAWLGMELICEPMNGRWGFGKTEENLRILDQAVVLEGQSLQGELDAALQVMTENNVLVVLRLATQYGQLVLDIDIASVIDLDGDAGNGELRDGIRAREADLREYDVLVNQARQALEDLDVASHEIDSASIEALYNLSSEDIEDAITLLSQSVHSSFRALSTLFIIAGEQLSAVDQGLIRGQIGVRSGKYIPPQPRRISGRPSSIISSISRSSRRSTATTTEGKRGRVRGLEEEFLDQRDYEESRDRAGDMPPSAGASHSASASTSSLAKQVSRLSATSSTTSLAYQQTESDRDSGSQKGNRSSILKAFRRNRAGSDADDSWGRSKTPSKKLAKLLGEDVNSIPFNLNNGATVPPPSQAETPWYLSDDFVPGEIMFDDKGGVKAGTLRALVVRLTQHSSTDTPFFQAFLLTFRSFTNCDELFEHLVARYNLEPPDNLTAEQLQEWKVKKQALIRLRVANALRTWLEKHYLEQADKPVLDRIENFANTTLVENGSELLSKQLVTLVAKRRQGEPDLNMRRGQPGLLSPPAPLVPRVTGKNMKATDISPLEIARQLTIIEYTNFARIKPSECLARNFSTDDSVAPNVRNVINTANRLAGFVGLSILGSRDPRVRAANMKVMIQVAMECRNLNNFSGMAGIVAGLNSAPITRLKRTKELLSAKTQALKAELDSALDTSKNFANYRDMLKAINPPCVPFFGFYLSTLTFIQDGNKDIIQIGALNNNGNPKQEPKQGMPNSTSSSSLSSIARPSPAAAAAAAATNGNGNGNGVVAPIPAVPLINFFKRALNAEILRDISQYQSQPYNLARCKPVWDFLEQEFATVESGKDLWEMSMQLEPREKEEERITRMLHDSGFI